MVAKVKKMTLVLIDAQALIHRAFHALPLLTDRRGQPTNAGYGFFSVFLKMIKDLAPDYIAACFDRAEPTFRDKAFKDYKAHRPKTPEALISQVPLVKEILSAFKVPVVELAGYEADDLIGTLAKKITQAHPDWRVIITTGDLDTLQLISKNVFVYTLKKGVSDTTIYNEAAVKKRYGLTPAQIADYKGLVGDQSDNIPGVKGIGEKSASDLLQKFGTLEKVFETLEKDPEKIPSRLREKLKAGQETGLFSKALATIRPDAPVEFKIQAAAWGQFDKKAVVESLQKYGFRSLIGRLPFETGDLVQAPQASVLKVKKVAALPKAAGTVGFYENVLAVKQGNEFLVSQIDFNDVAGDIITFDYKPLYKALYKEGGDLGKAGFDAMLAAWLYAPGRSSYEPDDLARRYFGAEPKFSIPLTESERQAVLRAALAEKIKYQLDPALKRQKLAKVFYDVELPLTPILARMEMAGIKLDASVLKKIGRELRTDIADLEKQIYQAAGGEFNIQSPKQLSEILFEKLKLPTGNIRKTPTGALSTDEQELAKLVNAHPIVADVLAFRERVKLLNTYVEPLPNFMDENGRVHTTFIQTGTVTGRLSSAEPNLQNIPLHSPWGKGIRSAFVAEKGHSFLSCDFSQIDLRVVAHIAQDERLRAAFERNEDIHATTAAAVLGVPLKAVTPEMRRRAKAVNFGIIYGLSAFGLSESTAMTREEAKKFIDAYLERFASVRRYMLKTKALAKKQGYVETLLGRRRYLPALQAGNFAAKATAEREAINHPVQGTSADIMKLAMIQVDKLLRSVSSIKYHVSSIKSGLFGVSEPKARREPRLLLQVHDELIFEVPDEQAAALAPKIKRAMANAYKLSVPLKVDVKIGKNWGQLKE